MILRHDWPHERMNDHIRESAAVVQNLVEACGDDVLRAAEMIAETFRSGGKLLLCGNGGSAADCQHMAAELTSRLTADFVRPGLPAIALTTDSSFLTAYANDCGYEGIFAQQVHALGRPGDMLVGISTSGTSANVIHAMKIGRAQGLRTAAFMGTEGILREMVDVSISVPSTFTQYVQEAHLIIEHILCDLVERHLFGLQGGEEA